MKFHFNWGTAIFLVIITFVGIMISIIIFSMNQQVNLVSPDYYPKGVDYDRQILKTKNLNSLKEKVGYEKSNDSLKIFFPKEFDYDKVSGTINFYFITDFEKDSNQKLKLTKANNQSFLLNSFEKGRYIIKLDWTDGQKEYYQEIDLNL